MSLELGTKQTKLRFVYLRKKDMKVIKTKVVVEKEITYDICESILDSNYSEQELAEQIIDDLGLIDGGIEFGSSYFSVDGERVNGSTIEVYQDGEYDM